MLIFLITLFPLLEIFFCILLNKYLSIYSYFSVLVSIFFSLLFSFILFYDVVSTGNIYKLTLFYVFIFDNFPLIKIFIGCSVYTSMFLF